MKKKILATVLAGIMTFSVVGCGGSSSGTEGASTSEGADAAQTTSESTEEASETTDTAAAEAPAGEDPYANGVLDIGVGAGLDSLTPYRSNAYRDQAIFIQLYEALGTFDAAGEMQGVVAKNWSTEDGLTYTLEIWDNVTDSAGNHITADDIVYDLEQYKERALKPCFAKMESVTKTGDYTIEVVMNADQVGAFEVVMSDCYVFSKAAMEADSTEFATAPVSTSPYVVSEFTPNSTITFEKREDYWQTDENLPECCVPVVDKLTYHTITEASQQGVALETGVVDCVIQMDLTTAPQYIDNSDYVVEQTTGPQGWQLFFSGADTSLCADDVHLRKAICYAIDNDSLVAGLCQGYGQSMHDVCSSVMVGYNPEWDNEEYLTYDVEKAKEELAQSNYNGEELTIFVSSSTFVTRLAQMIQNYCQAVGITIKVNSVEQAQYMANRLDGTQYDMTMNTIGGNYCSDHWSIRYDSNAYEAGDATSRKDETLTNLLYETWTTAGYTQENIDKVHEYIRDNAIAYGTVNPNTFCVWRSTVGATNIVHKVGDFVQPSATTWTSY